MIQYHPQHIWQRNGITRIEMIRGHHRTGIFCYITFENDAVIDCTFNLDNAKCHKMEKIAREVAAKHKMTL